MSAPVETPLLLEVAPPVEKPPAEVQEVAFVEDQVRVEDSPLSMVVGLADRRAVGAEPVTEQLWLVKLPEREPLVQTRVSDTDAQVVGEVTEGNWYAVTELPLAMVPPQGSAQEAAVTVTVTDWSGEVPPGPVHWKVKSVSEVRGLVSPLPESVPPLLHGPPAVQEVALVELQVRVERPL